MTEIKKIFSLQEIINFSKQNGFIFNGSEIYGGLANSFDYGHLGTLLKQNIKQAWIKKFSQEQNNIYLFDSSILLNSQVWKTSGHLDHFTDPLTENKDNNKRYRADKLIKTHNDKINTNNFTFEQMQTYLIEHNILGTKNWSAIKEFNLLFQTHQGTVLENSYPLFLRPETCQGIFINFRNIMGTVRKKIPFGIAQIGKVFRNEITPGNFIFRTCEFEQMELEFFCKPQQQQEWFSFWKKFTYDFLLDLGMLKDNLKLYDYPNAELSHYSEATTDILFRFPWGFDELWGIASRTDFDLKNHQKSSYKDLQYFDPITKEKYWPFVIEPSVGVERLFLAILVNSLKEETLNNDSTRLFLDLHPFLAPYKAAILPLNKNKHQYKARELQKYLCRFFMVDYDANQSIGKRYRRQDMIGTPFCCTVDDQTLQDNTITIRNRDDLSQRRIKIENLKEDIEKQIFF